MLAHVKERTRLDNLDTQVLMHPSQFGRRDGSNLHVALLGRPNAGTSTLFNALAGRRTSASPFLGETRRVNRGRCGHRTPEFEWLCQLYMPATVYDDDLLSEMPQSEPLEAMLAASLDAAHIKWVYDGITVADPVPRRPKDLPGGRDSLIQAKSRSATPDAPARSAGNARS